LKWQCRHTIIEHSEEACRILHTKVPFKSEIDKSKLYLLHDKVNGDDEIFDLTGGFTVVDMQVTLCANTSSVPVLRVRNKMGSVCCMALPTAEKLALLVQSLEEAATMPPKKTVKEATISMPQT